MADATTPSGLRYPELPDPPNVPKWVQNLAEDVQDLGVIAGAIDPEGHVAARSGSLYLRDDGTMYSKISGDETVNTGWVGRPANQDWIAYTPATANIQMGLRSHTSGKYIREGDLVHFSANLTIGSDAVMGHAPQIGLPFEAQDRTIIGGYCVCRGIHRPLITETVGLWANPGLIALNAGYAAYAPITHDLPATWIQGDQIGVNGSYEIHHTVAP